jgi:hypothetical protein
MATETSERSSIDATIVDVIEGPDHYDVAVGWSYEQKTPTHGTIPLGGEMLLRFSNGNTFKFDVDSGKLLEASHGFVGRVTKVRGNNVTIQLSNNRTVTVSPNSRLKLSVGDMAPEDLVQAFDR